MIIFKEFIKIWNTIIENGVVLYGAGRNAQLAIEVLHKNQVENVVVVDKTVGKQVSKYQALSLEEVCENDYGAVAIITISSRIDCTKEKELLEDHFGIVTDMSVIFYAKYLFPNDDLDFDYTALVPFNHYESPYSTVDELEFYNQYIKETEKYMHIDFQLYNQIKFFGIIQRELKEITEASMIEKKIDVRFKQNDYFDGDDAVLLYTMMMYYRPKRIIEIGSGYSTCIMLDVNQHKLNNQVQIKCIEPYPERLFSRIKKEEPQLEVRRNMVQVSPLEEFQELEENDILFIDSSHVLKNGGDIPYEYFNILPQLNSGVIIHIHDIFYPFVYPENFIMKGRAYTEAYVLRALLENNDDYEILFWNDMMQKKYKEQYRAVLPEKCNLCGGSLWIRKK